jgi:hypothetical protein
VGNKFSSHPITKLREISGEEVIEMEVEKESAQSVEVQTKGLEDIEKSAESKKVQKVPVAEQSETKQAAPVEEKEHKKENYAKEKKEIETENKVAQTKQNAENLSSEESNGFHSGDTVDMKIDLSKLKKGRDQLGLFDE